MTPQLYINYKLKSVAHLPWRFLCYRSLNTVIDDLFAFVIRMPTMHRLVRADEQVGLRLTALHIVPRRFHLVLLLRRVLMDSCTKATTYARTVRMVEGTVSIYGALRRAYGTGMGVGCRSLIPVLIATNENALH